MRGPFLARAVLAASGVGVLGCGSTTAPVLERLEPPAPLATPAATQRVDVFVVTSIHGCAIGRECGSADASGCFAVGPSNSGVSFEPASVDFVAQNDTRLMTAARSACFELALDPAGQELATRTFTDLRTSVHDLSGGAVELDVRIHELTPERGVFKIFEGGTGIFLQPAALEPAGLPLLSPDSDFVFAVTGETSPDTGALPRINPCGGTNWQAQGGLGGAAYTWLSQSCLSLSQLRWHFLYQAFFAMRDVVGFDDLYGGAYPGCGQGAAEPERWFPRPSDCTSDPDAPSCGLASCEEASFARHVLTSHWPSDPGLIGNHCRNGRVDYDETAPDTGGVCDELGR